MCIFFTFFFELFKFQSRRFVVEEKNPPFPLCAQASITGGSSEDSSNLLADLWYRGHKGPGWENLVNLFRFDVSTCIHINIVQYKLRPTTDVHFFLMNSENWCFPTWQRSLWRNIQIFATPVHKQSAQAKLLPHLCPTFFLLLVQKKVTRGKTRWKLWETQATTTNPTRRKDPPRLLGGEVTVKSCQVRLAALGDALASWLVGTKQVFLGQGKQHWKNGPPKQYKKHMLCIIHIIYFSQLIHRYTPDEMMYQCFSWIGMFYCQCFSINWEVFFFCSSVNGIIFFYEKNNARATSWPSQVGFYKRGFWWQKIDPKKLQCFGKLQTVAWFLGDFLWILPWYTLEN